MKKAIFLVGPPKSGKGEIGKHLRKHCSLLEMGAHLRELLAQSRNEHSSLQAVNHGGLVSDKTILRLLHAWIDEHVKDAVLALDGAPRTLDQAKSLLHYLKNRGFKTHTLWLSTPISECLSRNRVGRSDDEHSTLLRRMEIFKQHTQPIQRLLDTRSNFLEIDNTGIHPDKVYERVVREFELESFSAPLSGHRHVMPSYRFQCQIS